MDIETRGQEDMTDGVINGDQYKELQATSRHYDLNLWAIPGVVFVIAGGVATLIIKDGIIVKNPIYGIIVFLGFLATLSLLIAFEKTRSLQIQIQGLMNKYEKKKGIPQLELFHKKEGLWLCSAFLWMRFAIIFILIGYFALLEHIF